MSRKLRFSKAVTVLVALLVAVSGLSVWGSGGSGGPEVNSMSVYLDRLLLEEDGQAQWREKFTELTGIELEVIKPPHNQYMEVLNTSVFAGDIPDLAEIWPEQYVTYVTEGVLVPLDDLIANNANLQGMNSAYWEAYRAKDGKIYGFPTYKGGGPVMYMRADWLANLGLQPPKTYAEFVNVLDAFTNRDPDGNGIKDTIGYTIPYNVPAAEFDFYQRWVMQDAYFGFQQKSGQWVDGFTQPEFRSALARLIDLYSKGYIDAEFFSANTGAARSKLTEGSVGAFEYWSGTWATRLDTSAKTANANADIIPVAPISGAHYINRIGPFIGVTTAAANPQAVFDNIIGLMWDKGEGQTLFTYGVEGVHWERSGGVARMLPQLSNPDNPFQKSYIDPYLSLNDMDPLVAQQPKDKLSTDIHSEYAVSLSLLQGGDIYTTNVGELNTAKQEIFAKIIRGEVSVDAGLAEYQQRAASLNINGMLAELNS